MIIESIIFLTIGIFSLLYKRKKGWGGEHPEIEKFSIYSVILLSSIILVFEIIRYFL